MKYLRSQTAIGVITAIFLVSILIVATSERERATPLHAQVPLAELEGWAWDGDNIPSPNGGGAGWISFNSTNNPGASPQPFAVKYDPITGGLSGHAWSSQTQGAQGGGYGWLSFNRSQTGAPPSAQPDPCGALPPSGDTAAPTACFSGSALVGWARFLTACQSPFVAPCSSSGSIGNRGGWDGWVRFSGSWTNSASVNGVTIVGYAWGADSVGWISLSDPVNGCPPAGKYCVKKKYDFTLDQPGDISVDRGSSQTNSVTVRQIAGNPQSITLSAVVAGSPAGVSVSFSPTSCTPSPTVCPSTITVTTTSVAPLIPPDWVIIITGSDGTISRTTQFNLRINDSSLACGYYLSNNGDVVVPQGTVGTNSIQVFLKVGKTCPTVPFVSSGQPAGSTVSFSPVSCMPGPTCTSTMTITTASVAIGSYPITVRGNPVGGPQETTNFNLVVTSSVVCTGCPGDFTFSHQPYGDGEIWFNGAGTITHPHFPRDIAMATSHSTNTFLTAQPTADFADSVRIQVMDVQKDDGPPTSSPPEICAGFTLPCFANGIGDVTDLTNVAGGNVPLSQFTFKFNERVGTQITGVVAGIPVLFNVIRETALDGRYVIHLQACATSDPTKCHDTRVLLVIGASVPGFTEL